MRGRFFFLGKKKKQKELSPFFLKEKGAKRTLGIQTIGNTGKKAGGMEICSLRRPFFFLYN